MQRGFFVFELPVYRIARFCGDFLAGAVRDVVFDRVRFFGVVAEVGRPFAPLARPFACEPF